MRLNFTGREREAALRILAAPCLSHHPAILVDDTRATLALTLRDDWSWSSGERVLVDALVGISFDEPVDAGLDSGSIDGPTRQALSSALRVLHRQTAQ